METTTVQKARFNTIASEPWFVEFLARKGFTKSSDKTFTNGKALIRVDGTHFAADPRVGDLIYKVDFREAAPKTVVFMVEQILKMHPFRTDAELLRESAEKKSVDKALAGIALTISDGPDTGGGIQLRRFLWSLYNMHHLVNLWNLTAELDEQRSAWVTEVFVGTMSGLVQEEDLKRTLQDAGEMERWDKEQLSAEGLAELHSAQSLVAGLINKVPPSRSHKALVSLLGHIAEAQHELAGENP